MPEGDTIHRTARALDRVLSGQELLRVHLPRLRFRPFPEGTRIDAVQASGKHCLVHFDDGRVLRTHLGMSGSWHLYRPGERWRRSPAGLRALVAVPEWEAVCFGAPTVELTTEPAIGHLGPDLCSADADLEEALRRMDALAPETPIAQALLDQRVAAGIGNIWKNEACFACRVDPALPIGMLDDEVRRQLLVVASTKLRQSVQERRPPIAVYGRAGRDCPRCGATIEWARLGVPPRGTYWCPACQPARSGTPAR